MVAVLQEQRRGLTLLYICPLKALLNNLEPRISGYARLLGLRAGLWHGDIGAYRKFRLTEEPPEILMATPESLEVMLVSRRVDHRALFRDVTAVIVDEVHAFAGDDRGWHLISLLARIAALTESGPQRLGLSATVGNPERLLDWLAGDSPRGRAVIAPNNGTSSKSDVTLDHVGNLANAAKVIAGLHRGEKRLVFCDSRARTEELALALRELDVNTHLSHGSLGREERDRAETAFARETDCVIVATSTLELGIDVGDLDRVIQIDAPHTVASFLQRIGRTGRRPGSSRNCLFLATSESALLHAASLLLSWGRGRIEPVQPPPLPYHILAQQLLALVLQEGAVATDSLARYFRDGSVLSVLPRRVLREILDYMLQAGLLFEDGSLLSMGDRGQDAYGRRNFRELFSVFTSPPEFLIFHGRKELGAVSDRLFRMGDDKPVILLLAGRLWEVVDVDWRHRTARVRPGEGKGLAHWSGHSSGMSFNMARSAADVIAGVDPPVTLTGRARACLTRIRDHYDHATPDGLTDQGERETVWWSFAGELYNRGVRETLSGHVVRYDDFSVTFTRNTEPIRTLIQAFLAGPVPELTMNDHMIRALKFGRCLPEHLIKSLFQARFDLSETHHELARQGRAAPRKHTINSEELGP